MQAGNRKLWGNSIISQDNMQFHVIHAHPSYSAEERAAAMEELEKQLYAVFCRHVRPG